jgi:hypothetical protein
MEPIYLIIILQLMQLGATCAIGIGLVKAVRDFQQQDSEWMDRNQG